MKSEKGLFKDEDKYAKIHQDICSWFISDNAWNFVRFYLNDFAEDLEVKLETPVRSSSGFLYGFADVLLLYRTDQGHKHRVLIEAKSSISDFGAVLRQIRTYQEYLGDITKTCLIHADERWYWCNDDDNSLGKYFGSQGIYKESFDSMSDYSSSRLDKLPLDEIQGYIGLNIPSGRHNASLCGLWIDDKREMWALKFLLEYCDKKFNKRLVAQYDSKTYFHRKDEFWKILNRFEIKFDKDIPSSISVGSIDIPCSVEVAYPPDKEGSPEIILEKMYLDNEVIALK
jgi:hypothetical protein